MHVRTTTRPAFLFAIALSASGANAEEPIPAERDPAELANGPNQPEPEGDWQFRLGGGFLYGPAFLGSKDYQLRAGPNVEVRYKDRLFLSVIDGIGFDLIKTDTFRAGPVVKYQQKRHESGKGTFVIAGGRTDALRGLGDVPATAEAGGYVQYQAWGVSAKAEVRKGIGGHDGLIAELGARYSVNLTGMSVGGRPLSLSFGPRTTIVDNKYNQSYFGVDAGQSTRSGLALFKAKGGLLSYGMGATLVVPVADSFSAAMLGGFDRLAGDAAKSPLVRERGSRNQATVGFGLTYHFGR